MVRKTSQWYAAECVHACCVCLAASVCVSERLEKEKGVEAKETAKGEEEDEEGGVHRGPGGGASGESRLTGPARTHHLHQLVTHLPCTHNASPSISDVYTVVRERNNCKHHCSSDGIQPEKKKISSA